MEARTTMENLAELIIKLASLPVLATGIYALFIYKQLGRELKIFSLFIFLSAIIELISKILWLQTVNNLPLLHIYVAAGFVLLIWFYVSILKDYANPKILWGIAILFTIFTIINSSFYQTPLTFNSYAVTVQSVLIIILSLSTYILLLKDIVREKRANLIKSLNWINSGLFMYYTSSLLVFYFSDILINYFSATVNKYLWSVHTLFSIVMYVCFFTGLWKRPRI